MAIGNLPISSNAALAAQATEHWVEAAVIGLNLCPFARSVQVGKRVRYVVSAAQTPDALLESLEEELLLLQQTAIDVLETTLLIHPWVLNSFRDYNAFLGDADDLIVALALDGELQIASFHPDYQFAGTPASHISNYTNRSPFPTLHLLRECSVQRATESMPDTSAIYEANLLTLEKLGLEGWRALGVISHAGQLV